MNIKNLLLCLVIACFTVLLLLNHGESGSLRAKKHSSKTTKKTVFEKFTQNLRDKAPEWRTIGEEDFGVWLSKVDWSKWGPSYFACGVDIRIESKQGSGDDTAMNGLWFHACDEQDWYSQYNIGIESGRWGSWYNKIMCPVDGFIIGLQLRIEAKVGGDFDNSALNGLRFKCTNKKDWIVAHEGFWGDWREPVMFGSKFICGGRSKWLTYQGGWDDVAMSGLQVALCPVSPESLDAWQVVEMNFDMNKASFTTVRVIPLSSIQNNYLSSTQTSTIEFQIDTEFKTSYSTTDQAMLGVTFEASAEFSAGVEGVASTKFGIKLGLQASYTKTWTTGEEKTVKYSAKVSEQLASEPCSQTKMSLNVEVREFIIPYTTRLKNRLTNEQIQGSGVFKSQGLGPSTSERKLLSKLC